MKQCTSCGVTMFDKVTSCGTCNSSDLKQMTPLTQVLVVRTKAKKVVRNVIHRKSRGTYAQQKASANVTKLSPTLYEVRSKTNANKSYVINLNDMRDHKGDCLGYRYKQDCNHLKQLREIGVDV